MQDDPSAVLGAVGGPEGRGLISISWEVAIHKTLGEGEEILVKHRKKRQGMSEVLHVFELNRGV